MNYHLSSPPNVVKKFFASSNSARGFQNSFPMCFGEGSGIDLLYIIKGGPGTGKSHLLKTLGRCAEAHGFDTTYYACSSDPDSLDGLRAEKAGHPTLGFVDGTAPHVWEPTMPGVKEEIINLGIFWRGDMLQTHKAEIEALDKQKRACYTLTYHDLAACGEAIEAADQLISPCGEEWKMRALAGRLARAVKTESSFREITAYIRCIGMKGDIRLDTYEQLAEKNGGEIICIENFYGLGYRLLAMIRQCIKEKDGRILISRDPLSPHKIDGIYDMGSHTCFITDLRECPYPHRKVNLHRYLDRTAFKDVRGEVRHRLRLANEMMTCALEDMKKAGTHHFALESIYAAAMDFKAKDQFDKALCRRLFGD